MQNPMDSQPLTLQQVADHFQVSVRTVRRWEAAGLETYQMGRHVLTSREAIGRFAKSRSLATPHVSSPSADIERLQQCRRRA